MRQLLLLAALALAAVLTPAPSVSAEDAPRPRLDRIDHAKPKAQLALGSEVGAGNRAQGLARQLARKGQTPRQTLIQILRWVRRNLRLRSEKVGTWRTVDQILKDGDRDGDADAALVIGALARAAGIPTTWVKTLPVAWLTEAKVAPPRFEEGVGKVFLEVHLEGRWRLLDPKRSRLYAAYNPLARMLPGNRLAYDKGGDPHALVLPNRREPWLRQTRAFVAALDLNTVPWATSSDMLASWRVYITGKVGAASYARAACRALGYDVEKSFNTEYEEGLREARGKTLIVTCHRLTPWLPKAYWHLLPPGYEAILSGARKLEKGFVAHRLADGTRVILITAQDFGPVELAVSEALEG